MILTYIEVRDNRIKKASLEALSEAKRKAGELKTEAAAVLVGSGFDALAGELFPYGAARVYLLENPAFSRYSTQDYAFALAGLVKKTGPAVLFFSATSMGRDLAPRLAARLGVGLASDCTRVAVNDGKIEFTRPVFAGTVELPAAASKAYVAELVGESGGEIDVTEADIVISGGRGMKGPENFTLLKEVSALIPRSAVGASRSAVDSGWIDHQHQVGQTGKTVSPNLYMAFGISGAIQHLAGMSASKVIVAVNKDPDAPIFKLADFGVVGDLFQVIPVLKEEIKKLRG
jgi:electron transfer flavoprotein alpha subunit